MPPSVNHAYGRRGKQTFLTDAARAFRDEVVVAVRQSGFPVGLRLSEPVVEFTLRWPHKRRIDLNNLCKLLYDALGDALDFDDSEVCEEHHYKRYEPKREACLEVVVSGRLDWPRPDIRRSR